MLYGNFACAVSYWLLTANDVIMAERAICHNLTVTASCIMRHGEFQRHVSKTSDTMLHTGSIPWLIWEEEQA